jgi:hypothetical protein
VPAEQEVTIIIIGKDAASKIFKQVGDSAEKEGKKIEKSFVKSLEKAGKAATQAGKKLSIGVTAPLGVFAGVALDSAMKADRLQRTLDGLAGGADRAATFINAIKDASQGTIPQVEALAIANRALSFGVVQNAEEMADLTQIAIALGRAQGLDAATAVSDLTTALSRQSPMILDNLGITIKAGDANKAYAEKLGISTDALTGEQKAIAFRTAALEKGKAVVSAMGGVQDDMAASGERVKAQMADMALTIGQALIPIMQQALDIIGPLIKGFTELDPGMQKVVIAMGALVAASGPALTAFGAMASAAAAVTTKLAAIQAGTFALNPALLALAAAVGIAAGAWAGYQKIAHEVAEGQENVRQALSKWDEDIAAAVESGESLSDAMGDLAGRYDEAKAAMDAGGIAADLLVNQQKILMDTVETANRAAAEASGTYEDYQVAVAGWNREVGDSKGRIITYAQAQEKANKLIQSSSVHLSESAAMARVMRENVVMLSEAQYELIGNFEAFGETVSETSVQASESLVIMTATVVEAATETQRLREESLEAALAQQNQLVPAAEQVDQKMMTLLGTMQSGIVVTDQSAVANRLAAAAYREAEAAALAEAAAAEEQAAALAESAAQAQAAAVEQTNLAARMKDATSEQVAQALISQLDPEQLGATAYTDAVTDIQIAFGLADEKSIALAQNIGTLSDAINEGVVPPEKAAEALTLMQEAAGKGVTDVGELIGKFEAVPEPVDRAKLVIDDTSEALKDVDTSAVEAGGSVSDFGANAVEAAKDAQTLKDDVIDTTEALVKFAQDYTATVTIEYVTIGSPPSGGGPPSPPPHMQFGGVVPGPIGRPQPIIAHGGEIVLNPRQTGALGGPGGPTIGGDTYQVTINNELAAAMFLAEQRQRRFERLDARM